MCMKISTLMCVKSSVLMFINVHDINVLEK